MKCWERYTTSLQYSFNLYLIKEKHRKYKINRLFLLQGTDVCTRFKIPRATIIHAPAATLGNDKRVGCRKSAL